MLEKPPKWRDHFNNEVFVETFDENSELGLFFPLRSAKVNRIRLFR